MNKNRQAKVPPWTRVLILLVAVLGLGWLSYHFTGRVLPSNPEEALIFQNALLLIVLGSALLEAKFTKPADSVVNSLMGMITLLTVYRGVPEIGWWSIFTFCAFVFLMSSICTAVSSGSHVTGWRRRVADWTYRPAVVLGAARRIFSVLFLYGVFSFYEMQSQQTAALVLFWAVFIVLWPLGVPELLSKLTRRASSNVASGNVIRTDSPNIVRVALDPKEKWDRNDPMIYSQSDGRVRWVIPLYSQVQDQQILGTGILADDLDHQLSGLADGFVYTRLAAGYLEPTETTEILGGGPTSRLAGFIVEDSEIAEIRFEAFDSSACSEGMLVWCVVGDQKVFFQVTNGVTREEALESDRHGYQIAVAAQLGTLNGAAGFEKFSWLPTMNTPVFAEPESFGADIETTAPDDFVYGQIPKSRLKVSGPFVEASNHHTAILGVTGSGKTELAFDLIRHAIEKDQKVICIDLTSQYRNRLADLNHSDLSISEKLASDLGSKLFDVETGQYGAGAEKKALEGFAIQLRDEISTSIQAFLCSHDEGSRLGIIELNEISNTKATLYVTELYLTCLLHFAKDHPDECPPVMIVVEEAHTVMPEPSTMGLGDYDSRGLVGKIAQIALQGRKYGVGLLVLAQRTATVSKTVLTQCNTIISFTCYDDTSLGFLKNIFGKGHVDLIPNLPPLHAVIFGKAVRSQRPVVVEIPYDPMKANS